MMKQRCLIISLPSMQIPNPRVLIRLQLSATPSQQVLNRAEVFLPHALVLVELCSVNSIKTIRKQPLSNDFCALILTLRRTESVVVSPAVQPLVAFTGK